MALFLSLDRSHCMSRRHGLVDKQRAVLYGHRPFSMSFLNGVVSGHVLKALASRRTLMPCVIGPLGQEEFLRHNGIWRLVIYRRYGRHKSDLLVLKHVVRV